MYLLHMIFMRQGLDHPRGNDRRDDRGLYGLALPRSVMIDPLAECAHH
jgi:hypothetical protein